MKKFVTHVLFMTCLVIGSLAFTACGNSTEPNADSKESTEMAEATYACPMDCEKGKTYEEPGSCPVCGMDLKETTK
jgi:hypothetical protein